MGGCFHFQGFPPVLNIKYIPDKGNMSQMSPTCPPLDLCLLTQTYSL